MKPIYIEPIAREREYQRLAALGRELKVPIFEQFLELKVILPGDKQPVHWHKQRSHSYTRNAYNLLACDIMAIRGTGGYSAGQMSIRTTAGTVVSSVYCPIIGRCCSYGPRSDNPEAGSNTLLGSVGNANYGILVGTGSTAESFEGYALASPCAEGTGANQLNYMAMGAPQKSWDGPTLTLTIILSRYMNNNSAGTITIGEIALVTQAAHNNAYCNTVLSRDVLGSPVAVPASGQILSTYTLAMVYPE